MALAVHEIAGIVTICGLVPLGSLIYLFWDNRRNYGVMWWIVGLSLAGLWAGFSGSNNLIHNESFSFLLLSVERTVAIFSTVALFFFILEYTTGKTIGWRFALPFCIIPLVTQVVLWTNPALFFTYEIADNGVSSWEPIGFGLLHFGYAAFLHVMASGMLLRAVFITAGRQRKQAVVLTVAYVTGVPIAFLGAVGFTPDYSHPVILGVIYGAVIVAFGLVRYGLFTTSPIGKENVFREIEDAVLIFNHDGRVVDMTPLAKQIFHVRGNYVGQTKSEIFAAHESWAETLLDEAADPSVLEVTMAAEELHFVPNRTAFEYGRGLRGEVWVLRDATEVRSQQQDLDLIRQIFSRIFRHNVRNNMVTIQGHAKRIQERAEDEPFLSSSETILRVADELVRHTDKARQIEDVFETGREVNAHSLSLLTASVIEEYDEMYPDSTIRADVADIEVLVIQGFEKAIANAVENALEHNPSPVEVQLTSAVHDGTVTLAIEDTGTGIDAHETTVLSEGEETDLQHGSGVGLWLMKWYVEKSNGEIRLENTGDGTRVEMDLSRGETDA